MFHIGMWRERLRNALADLNAGRTPTAAPNADELNEAELPSGIGTPLADAAARSDHLLGEIMELYESVGELPMDWYVSRNTTEAVLRNSYIHPRRHLYAYLQENGEQERANQLFEDAFQEMQDAQAPPVVMNVARYNLACARCHQGRADEALKLLEEVLAARPDMKPAAAGDSDFSALRDDPRFQDLVKG